MIWRYTSNLPSISGKGELQLPEILSQALQSLEHRTSSLKQWTWKQVSKATSVEKSPDHGASLRRHGWWRLWSSTATQAGVQSGLNQSICWRTQRPKVICWHCWGMSWLLPLWTTRLQFMASPSNDDPRPFHWSCLRCVSSPRVARPSGKCKSKFMHIMCKLASTNRELFKCIRKARENWPPRCPRSKNPEIGNLSTFKSWPQSWFQKY
jgi:hypothetical protein